MVLKVGFHAGSPAAAVTLCAMLASVRPMSRLLTSPRPSCAVRKRCARSGWSCLSNAAMCRACAHPKSSSRQSSSSRRVPVSALSVWSGMHAWRWFLWCETT
jgi:hypothetical protein